MRSEQPKRYNSKKMKALLTILIAMKDSEEIDFDVFNDYTGLGKKTYSEVLKMIEEMLIDLNMKFQFKRVKIQLENNKTRYYIYKYKFHVPNPIDYSYNIPDKLGKIKLINYSLVLVYLMLRNNEIVRLNRLETIFPNFKAHKLMDMMHSLKDIVDGDLYREGYQYKLKEWDYE